MTLIALDCWDYCCELHELAALDFTLRPMVRVVTERKLAVFAQSRREAPSEFRITTRRVPIDRPLRAFGRMTYRASGAGVRPAGQWSSLMQAGRLQMMTWLWATTGRIWRGVFPYLPCGDSGMVPHAVSLCGVKGLSVGWDPSPMAAPLGSLTLS